MDGTTSQPTLYYLGPEGTYTHQAGHNLFQTKVRYAPISTITGLFEALINAPPNSNTLAIAPIENSQHGAVIETLDALQLPTIGEDNFVRGEFEFPISHSLVVRVGTKREDVHIVASHQQALGQCAAYLKAHLSRAALKETTSSAAAARSVLEDSTGRTAAICSSLCVELYPGLEVMEENVQDSRNNVTRFILLSKGLNGPPPFPPPSQALDRRRAMFRFDYSIARYLSHLTTTHHDLLRVDRRPLLPGDHQSHSPSGPFRDVYFVTLGGKERQESESAHEWSLVMSKLLMILQEGKDTSDTGSPVRLIGLW